MASYSRFAAIAKRSYFDPEDDDDEAIPASTSTKSLRSPTNIEQEISSLLFQEVSLNHKAVAPHPLSTSTTNSTITKGGSNRAEVPSPEKRVVTSRQNDDFGGTGEGSRRSSSILKSPHRPSIVSAQESPPLDKAIISEIRESAIHAARPTGAPPKGPSRRSSAVSPCQSPSSATTSDAPEDDGTRPINPSLFSKEDFEEPIIRGARPGTSRRVSQYRQKDTTTSITASNNIATPLPSSSTAEIITTSTTGTTSTSTSTAPTPSAAPLDALPVVKPQQPPAPAAPQQDRKVPTSKPLRKERLTSPTAINNHQQPPPPQRPQQPPPEPKATFSPPPIVTAAPSPSSSPPSNPTESQATALPPKEASSRSQPIVAPVPTIETKVAIPDVPTRGLTRDNIEPAIKRASSDAIEKGTSAIQKGDSSNQPLPDQTANQPQWLASAAGNHSPRRSPFRQKNIGRDGSLDKGDSVNKGDSNSVVPNVSPKPDKEAMKRLDQPVMQEITKEIQPKDSSSSSSSSAKDVATTATADAKPAVVKAEQPTATACEPKQDKQATPQDVAALSLPPELENTGSQPIDFEDEPMPEAAEGYEVLGAKSPMTSCHKSLFDMLRQSQEVPSQPAVVPDHRNSIVYMDNKMPPQERTQEAPAPSEPSKSGASPTPHATTSQPVPSESTSMLTSPPPKMDQPPPSEPQPVPNHTPPPQTIPPTQAYSTPPPVQQQSLPPKEIEEHRPTSSDVTPSPTQVLASPSPTLPTYPPPANLPAVAERPRQPFSPNNHADRFPPGVCGECKSQTTGLPLPHFASAMGHLACLLAAHQHDNFALLSFDAASRSPLFYASANNRPDCCEFLIEQFPPMVNLADINGDTPLHAACGGGSEACAKLLLTKGRANPSPANKLGMAPAHLAKNGRVVHELYQVGANLSIKDKQGRTPLYLSCATNRIDCATYLCEVLNMEGISSPDRRGDTPLHAAAFHGNKECLLLLLQYGAPPTTANNKGLTPIHLARKKDHIECLKLLQEYRLHHSAAFDSVLFLASVEGLRAGKQQDPTLYSTQSVHFKHYDEWICYKYGDERTFWYNCETGAIQWDKPSHLQAARSPRRMKEAMKSMKLQEVGDWLKYTSNSTKSFYYNQQNGDFTFDKPGEFDESLVIASTSSGAVAEYPASTWQVYRDANGNVFYYNTVTQQSQWEIPSELEGYSNSGNGNEWVSETEQVHPVNELSDLGV